MADLDLARRAVAATGWARQVPPGTDRDRSGVLWVDVAPPGPDVEWLPDLDDPATVGCLLALVRERWGDDAHLRLYPQDIPRAEQRWGLFISGEHMAMRPGGGWPPCQIAGPTRVVALVAALEVRP